METIEIYYSRYRYLASGQEFHLTSFVKDLSQEWGQKYYITEEAEAAIVDLINAEPLGMVNIDYWVENLWVIYGPKDVLNGKAKVKQAAWRFVADLSRNGRLWYFEKMGGHPRCGKLLMYNLDTIRSRREHNEPFQLYSNAESVFGEIITTEPQSLGFTKWLGLPESDKQAWMQQFLSWPQYYDVRTLADPIYPHPFHPELTA